MTDRFQRNLDRELAEANSDHHLLSGRYPLPIPERPDAENRYAVVRAYSVAAMCYIRRAHTDAPPRDGAPGDRLRVLSSPSRYAAPLFSMRATASRLAGPSRTEQTEGSGITGDLIYRMDTGLDGRRMSTLTVPSATNVIDLKPV